MGSSPVKLYSRSTALWLVVIVLGITLTVRFWPASEKGAEHTPPKVAKLAVIVEDIPLDPENWSEWQHLQVGDEFSFDNGPANWLEVQYFDGTTRRFEPKERVWLGENVRSRTFRFRGPRGSIVKLVIERRV